MKFLKSKTFINFWKFTLIGTLISGALVTFCGIIGLLFGGSSGGLGGAFLFGTYGLAFGLVAATVGYLLTYALARTRFFNSFTALSIAVSTLLAIAVNIPFFSNLAIGPWLLLFPTVPFIGSVYFFTVFAKKYIQPIVFEL